MMLVVRPTHVLAGTITCPSSKSYSIRSVIIAACGGRSTIRDLSDCDDVQQALKACRALGVSLRPFSRKKCLGVRAPKFFPQGAVKINVGESGTVLRFLLPLLALRNDPSQVTGQGTLRTRPNKFLTQTLRAMGKDVQGRGRQETVPVVLTRGALKGGAVSINGSLSSQFISALLIACPLLKQDTRLKIFGKTVVSKPYIAMTLAVLKRAGIVIEKKTDLFYRVKGRQTFKGLKNFTVPSDYGLAAFLLAAGALSPSRLVLQGFFDDQLVQADGQILDLLEQMGVKISKQKRVLRLKGPYVLKGGNFCLRDCPDLVPVMAVLGLFARGRTRLYGIAHARAKESDRISDLRRELLKIGARIREKKDELIIDPQPAYRRDVLLDPHHDHRLAMAFTVLGSKIGARIKDIECAAKSYPGFVTDVLKVGGDLRKR